MVSLQRNLIKHKSTVDPDAFCGTDQQWPALHDTVDSLICSISKVSQKDGSARFGGHLCKALKLVCAK